MFRYTRGGFSTNSFPRECSQARGVNVGILGRLRRQREINRGRKIPQFGTDAKDTDWEASHTTSKTHRRHSHKHTHPHSYADHTEYITCVCVCVRNSVIEGQMKCWKGVREAVHTLKWFGNGKWHTEKNLRWSFPCLSATGSVSSSAIIVLKRKIWDFLLTVLKFILACVNGKPVRGMFETSISHISWATNCEIK